MSRAERIARLQRELTARASIQPPEDWLPVLLAGVRIGTSSPDVASFLVTTDHRCALLDYNLVFDDEALDIEARSRLLNGLAQHLREAGLLRGWRNEQLDVRPLEEGATDAAAALATIERSACRALGITTHAVHLNGFTDDGRLWVAQRATHKGVDPGMWDNLVGGMVAAGEGELLALERESLEEAGLGLGEHRVARGGLVREQRLVPEGHLVETVQVFDLVLPATVQPRNQDGEVQRFELRGVDAVLDAIERDEFTLEAALVTLDGLMRQEAGHE
jgi:8-oxo-dGTP pyrophosphatase MutT (NUDIX family)